MRPLPAVFALALGLALGACGGEGTGPEDDGIHGTYALIGIDNGALPFILQDNPLRKVEVLEGELILRADGTFQDRIDYRVTPAGGAAGPDQDFLNGTFTQEGTTLRLTPQPDQGTPYELAVLSSGRLLLQLGLRLLTYEK